MRKYTVSLLLLAAASFAVAQAPDPKKTRDDLETIMRLQDLRTTHDGKLLNLLSDKNPVVRERATLAYGTIQDTSALPPLLVNLNEGPLAVQYAAAFAIGQTASQLSKRGKETLEHELIWDRLQKTDAADRLINEIGKFGTEQALNDLVLRFGSGQQYSSSMIMSIARFGIRGISSAEAVNYLYRFVTPTESAQWQAVYALQRIGNHERTRQFLPDLIALYKHDNPLVRMNLATLLGKIKDESLSLDPLLRLADHDADWRVRVNAFKALTNFDLNDRRDIIDAFRRAFYHSNPHVATTALSSFGSLADRKLGTSAELQRALEALHQLALNEGNGYLWQVQAEAAIGLAKLSGTDAASSIAVGEQSQPLLQAAQLNALGLTGLPQTRPILEAHLEHENAAVYRSALEGLQSLSQKHRQDTTIIASTYEAAIRALRSNDVAVVTTAASLLGDSLFLRPSSVLPLAERLSSLRVPDDVEAMQEIASSLGKLGDANAVPVLEDQLASRDRSVANAAAMALSAITGKSYAGRITRYDEPIYVDFDFTYLRSLPETVRVKIETIRGDFTLELYKKFAPFTVMSMLKLATQRGFYRGLPFHRVVPNFVIQGGDPRGDGWGGPGYSIRSEFSPLTYETGTVGIASAGKDTEGSQFFVTQSPQPHLDGRYTIVGKVVSGMDVVNKILVDDHIYDFKIIK